jgi:hypothetical protein
MCVEERHPMNRREHLLRFLALRIPTVVLREPFSIFVLGFLGLASGLMVLGLVPLPLAITGVLGSGPAAWVWALGLVTGSLLGLAGLLRRLWWLESGALWLVVTALVVHAVGTIQVFGGRAPVQVAFAAGLAVAGTIKAIAVAAAVAIAGFRTDHEHTGGLPRAE